MISLEEIRSKFLSYFESNNHKLMKSSQLIPENDPSLLFTNAGMVQYKDWFTGAKKPKYKNVVTSQKCLRAGGKHNDLENVGYTPRHHTFFEMLGNFSFGSYFKEEAIELAWNFLIKEFNISRNKLIITVFNDDIESFNIWKKITNFNDSQIIKISTDDNFWSMGESGPCGPCSEIFFDNGKKVFGGLPGSKNQDGNRYIEIWNLVFMQFEKKNNSLSKLPIKCVDTGMGLERISAVLNGKLSNYEIDIFEDIISELENLTKKKISKENHVSFRVISDHIRAIVFLISEGVLPSNEGRGYVLRRIIRRASRHLSLIGYEKPLLYNLVKVVCENYRKYYFELEIQKKFIMENLRFEEEKFIETLKSGLKLLSQEIGRIKNQKFPSEVAFKLYDTYGFPVDLTETIVKEKKLSLNLKEVNSLLEEQKTKSRDSWKIGEKKSEEKFVDELKTKFKITNFTGYKNAEHESKLKAIISDGKFYENSKKCNDVILVFDNTPFYAESGGQVGDIGQIFDKKNGEKICEIFQTKKEGQFHLHYTKKISCNLIVGKSYFLKINRKFRLKSTNNHTATHLLHESLRMTLGEHVKQKGSYVSPEKLRFDFTNNKPVNNDDLQKIEKLINKVIRKNFKVETNLMTYTKAIESGAIGLFGEKYSDEVRVVSVGNKKDELSFSSSELCGGTHVNFTGEIGSIKILSETSVSSGIRRIEAITGEENDNYNNQSSLLLNELNAILKTNNQNIKTKIEKLILENNNLKKSNPKKNEIFDFKYLRKINETNVYIQTCDLEVKELKNHSDLIKKKIDSGIILLISTSNKKVTLVLSITEDLKQKFKANILIKELSVFFGGNGGGGREDLAQGGGTDLSQMPKIEKFISQLIKV